MLASSGLATPPWGVPRVLLLPDSVPTPPRVAYKDRPPSRMNDMNGTISTLAARL